MDILTELETLPTADGLMPAYVFRPTGSGSHAAVVVVMGGFGLNAHIKVAVPFYGGGIAADTPTAPINLADRIQCPVLCFFGETDKIIPNARVFN